MRITDQQMYGRRVAAVPQVQHHVLGEREGTVGVAGRGGERGDRVDLVRGSDGRHALDGARGLVTEPTANVPARAGAALGSAPDAESIAREAAVGAVRFAIDAGGCRRGRVPGSTRPSRHAETGRSGAHDGTTNL